jgi:hypothetical protein
VRQVERAGDERIAVRGRDQRRRCPHRVPALAELDQLVQPEALAVVRRRPGRLLAQLAIGRRLPGVDAVLVGQDDLIDRAGEWQQLAQSQSPDRSEVPAVRERKG